VADTPGTETLLRRWGMPHAVRTAVSVVSLTILATHLGMYR
jgi:hypothetical protein